MMLCGSCKGEIHRKNKFRDDSWEVKWHESQWNKRLRRWCDYELWLTCVRLRRRVQCSVVLLLPHRVSPKLLVSGFQWLSVFDGSRFHHWSVYFEALEDFVMSYGYRLLVLYWCASTTCASWLSHGLNLMLVICVHGFMTRSPAFDPSNSNVPIVTDSCAGPFPYSLTLVGGSCWG